MSSKHIIVDLEATCWGDNKTENHEIIEIGAVMLKDEELTSVFQTFVKPVINPILSEYCKNLTTIKQVDVDTAPEFRDAIHNFLSWARLFEGEYKIWSWGLYDRKQFTKDCNYHKIGTIWLDDHHYNLKNEFSKNKRIKKRMGIKRALQVIKEPLEGEHHRAIDDAMNIAKIFNESREWYEKNSVKTTLHKK